MKDSGGGGKTEFLIYKMLLLLFAHKFFCVCVENVLKLIQGLTLELVVQEQKTALDPHPPLATSLMTLKKLVPQEPSQEIIVLIQLLVGYLKVKIRTLV